MSLLDFLIPAAHAQAAAPAPGAGGALGFLPILVVIGVFNLIIFVHELGIGNVLPMGTLTAA